VNLVPGRWTSLAPPPGHAPPLATYQSSPLELRRDVLMILAMYMLVGLGFTALRGFFWAAWLILLAFAILHIFLVCGSCVAIGSDWFKSDTGPRWIDPTHLTSVKLRMSTFETMVVLRDDAERWVEVSLDDLGRGRSVRQAFATALAESGARGLVLDPAIAARLPLDTTFQARVRES
jgi:hypothetical protein